MKSKRKLIAIMMIMHEFFDERKREKVRRIKKNALNGEKRELFIMLALA